jgi:hypothetical protein
MFRKFFHRLKRNQVPVTIDQREREALIRENAEARGENLGRDNKAESLGDKFIDQASVPGVVGDMTVIITRTAEEQRARNKPSI